MVYIVHDTAIDCCLLQGDYEHPLCPVMLRDAHLTNEFAAQLLGKLLDTPNRLHLTVSCIICSFIRLPLGKSPAR